MYAWAQVSPGLHDCIRGLLQGQNVQAQNIQNYLNSLGDVKIYDSAFKKLQVGMENLQIPWHTATVSQVAEALLILNIVGANDARNSYGAVLLLPGFQSIRYS